jgi:hypothetical protein
MVQKKPNEPSSSWVQGTARNGDQQETRAVTGPTMEITQHEQGKSNEKETKKFGILIETQ